MRKNFQIKKQLVLWLLLTAFVLHALIPEPFAVFAQETYTINEQISIASTNHITVNTAGTTLRIYGTAGTSYNVPIDINVSCTVILDHVENTADLTIVDGARVFIRLKGTNQVNNICATGGEQTSVYIEGDAASDSLTANRIACASAASNAYDAAPTGALVQIERCKVTCSQLSCGDHATDKKFTNGSDWISSAPRGGNASPRVYVRYADLTVNGNVACGGNGVYSEGTSTVNSSDGGSAGAVFIESSTVHVTGNVSVGGKGGNGVLPWYGTGCTAGTTKSSCPVTITNQSLVSIAGNLATQQGLPDRSNNGTQTGLDGVTVTVSNSVLTAKDIASGGSGHARVKENHTANSAGGYDHDVIGTAGGRGGTLIANNAQITCETAVCGASAGEYQHCSTDSNGNVSGDTAYAGHPMDGNGGSIQASESYLTFSKYAAARGSRWSAFANPAGYNDSRLIGGTLSGTVYGRLITTDLTSIVKGGFVASNEVRNTQEATCARSSLITSAQLAGQTVKVTLNTLEKNVRMGSGGTLNTYLPIGNQSIKIQGNASYYGEIVVKRAESENVFTLNPFGMIHIASGDAVIRENSYSYDDETHSYTGNYTISSNSPQSTLSVESGSHVITMEETALGTLSVQGTANVTLELSDQVSIRCVNVDPEASLTVSGSGCLKTDMLGNENGTNGSILLKSGTIQANTLGGTAGGKDIYVSDIRALTIAQANSPLRNDEGNRLHLSEILFEAPGIYTVTLNDQSGTIEVGEDRLAHLILEEGSYDLNIQTGPFCYRGDVLLTEATCMKQEELTLYVDCSDGEVVIAEHAVSVGADTIETNADICIIQSGAANPVRVEKTTANIQLGSGTDASLQIELPTDFQGTVRDASGILIAGPAPVETPPDTPAENDPDSSGTQGENPSHSGNTSQDGNISQNGDASQGGNTSQSSGSSQGGNTSQSSGISKDNKIPQNENSTQKEPSNKPTSETVTATAGIPVQTSLKSLALIDLPVRNVYRIFTKDKVSLTVNREAGTEYYYKILQKGQNNTAVEWRRLLTDKITTEDTNLKQRIVLKAVTADKCTIQKTPGFMVDTRSPEIAGIKNGAFYKGKRTICVSDNSGSCTVSLNGKMMDRTFNVQKKGIYLLKASDTAGNKRTMLFAIL